MSLKDRLNTANATNNPLKKEIESEAPKYYETNEQASKSNTLGVLDMIFADDDVNNIFVNGAKNIYIEKQSKSFKTTAKFRDEIQLENIVKRYLPENFKGSYYNFNYSKGVNVEMILPPISSQITLNVKIYKEKYATLQVLQEKLAISKETALILEALCSIKSNVLIVGKKNTGKTTLLNAILKNLPTNHRAAIVDFADEIENLNSNFSNFNLKNCPQKEEIFSSILSTSPNKIFINDLKDEVINQTLNYIEEDNNGVFACYKANSAQNALYNIACAMVKNNPAISLEEAKARAYRAFDIVITLSKDEVGFRRLSSVSQTNVNNDNECEILDIFSLNHLNEIKSTGLTPRLYEINQSSMSLINGNIFDEDYKHTYYQISESPQNIDVVLKKSLNIDILKKFKKELPANENISLTEKNEEFFEKENENEEEIEKLFENSTVEDFEENNEQ